MVKKFNSIQCEYFQNGKDTLAVILPGASLLPRSHDRLIKQLSQHANVLLVEDGYFGLRTLDDNIPRCKAIPPNRWNDLDTCMTDYNRVSFCKNLHLLIRKYPHRNLVILASSVGTIHALTYSLTYPKEVGTLVLAALPIGSNLLNFILFVSTHFLLSTSPDLFLGFILKLYGIFSRTKKVASVMQRTKKNIGAQTYLLCLKEIAIFSLRYKKQYEELIGKKSKPRTIIIAGTDDPIFNRYCNTPMCQNAFALHRVPARHAPFVEAPEETYNKINKYI